VKKIWNLVLTAGLILATHPGCGRETAPGEIRGTITVSGAWALYPLVIRWAGEFKKLHPAVRIDISAGGAGKGMADCLGGVVDLGMVSREINPAELERGAWSVAVAKDAVVPVMNRENPAAETIHQRGLSREELIGVWLPGGLGSWPAPPGLLRVPEMTVYTRSDACGAAEVWARYLGGEQEDLGGVGVYGDPGLAQAVRRDFGGIGFNNINYAYDLKTGTPVGGLMVIPIDLNGNGRVDPEENFYGTLPELTAAIADGRYPSPPARDLYLVSGGQPKSEPVRVFLSWILGEGRAYVEEAGYIALAPEKLAAGREKLRLSEPGPAGD